ncbi:MAG: ACP S-malonyltransferase [Sedimentisphaerales bacterium]|nr:ACP S-malonyltransferase [Sedimentisphaerales bacterium]
MKTAFVFPGQGAQTVGMGHDAYAASAELANLFRQAGEIVGYDLATICFQGPEEKLNATAVSQPAIFTVSAVLLQAVRMGLTAPELKNIQPDICAGLSLGEYTALYAAGAMSFSDTVRLVDLRGRSMQRAADARPGAMVSILGLDETKINDLINDVITKGAVSNKDLSAVNFNCPGQIVLSGAPKACEQAAQLAEKHGASRAIPLAVAGAFHTAMMDPAAEQLRTALQRISLQKPACPVMANVDAGVYTGVEGIVDKLLAQLVSPVRWQQCVEKMLADGVERFVEIGPGRVLTGLIKKTAREKKVKIDLVTINGIAGN